MTEVPANLHFCQRAAERGITCDPAVLYDDLCRALAQGGHGVIEHCFELSSATDPEGKPLRSLWRFRGDDGVFYAVVSNVTLRPVTVLTHDQMKYYREARRRQRAKGRKAGRLCKK